MPSSGLFPIFFSSFSTRRTAAPPSSEPETDQQNQDKRCQNEPRDHNDFDSQLAHGRDVVVNIRIAVKESVTVAKNVGAAQQIDDEEECCSDSKSRQNCRINLCEHMHNVCSF